MELAIKTLSEGRVSVLGQTKVGIWNPGSRSKRLILFTLMWSARFVCLSFTSPAVE